MQLRTWFLTLALILFMAPAITPASSAVLVYDVHYEGVFEGCLITYYGTSAAAGWRFDISITPSPDDSKLPHCGLMGQSECLAEGSTSTGFGSTSCAGVIAEFDIGALENDSSARAWYMEILSNTRNSHDVYLK